MDSVDVGTREEEKVENNLLSDTDHIPLDQSGRSKRSLNTHEDVADNSVETGDGVDDEGSTEVDVGEREEEEEETTDSDARVEDAEVTGSEEVDGSDGTRVEDAKVEDDEGSRVAEESSEDDLYQTSFSIFTAFSSVCELKKSALGLVMYSQGGR